jgi:hypothetical protein
MRPRNFLTLVNHCKSSAVNLQRDKIQEDDIRKACAIYSADISNEMGLEIRDVFPAAEDIPYYFIGFRSPATLGEIKKTLSDSPVPEDCLNELIEILLWFGFLGVKSSTANDAKETYIYDVFYDMKKLKRLAGNLQHEDTPLFIHRAFWPFLEIEA